MQPKELMRVHPSCFHNESELKIIGFFRAFEHIQRLMMVCSWVRGAICNPFDSFECACKEQSFHAHSYIPVLPTYHVVVLFMSGTVVEVFQVGLWYRIALRRRV
jgi:hypothetical protein